MSSEASAGGGCLLLGVVFQKENDGLGTAPGATEHQVMLKRPLPEGEGLLRCWMLLRRDLPSENVANWHVAKRITDRPRKPTGAQPYGAT